MNYSKQWKKFDIWWRDCSDTSWSGQQKKIEELFPFKNWKEIWSVYNRTTNKLYKIGFYDRHASDTWNYFDKPFLNLLIKNLGEK